MSEGLAAVRLLSADTRALSARWMPGTHVSEIGETNFQIGAFFINKPQIWVLNSYSLAWNTLITAFHDTITGIFEILRFSPPPLRSLIGAKCILGYLAASSSHKSPLDASLIKGAEQEHIQGFELYLARCELGIGTVLGRRLMTFHKSTRTQVQIRTHIEKRHSRILNKRIAQNLCTHGYCKTY